MKSSKTIQQIAEEYADKFYKPHKSMRRTSFISGFNYAKEHPELLRELFEEFAEWVGINATRLQDGQWYLKKDGHLPLIEAKFYTMSELFDLWIEQRNKQQ